MKKQRLKTIRLLEALQKDELKQLSTVLQRKGRQSLTQLYKYLLNNKDHPLNKEELFEAAFAEPYKKEKDYLIRNELRLLNNKIYDLLVHNRLTQKMDDDYYFFYHHLLREFKDRRLEDILEKTFHRVYKKAKQEREDKALVKLIDIYFKYVKDFKEIEFPLYKEIHQLVVEQHKHFIKSFLTRLRQIETHRAFLERALQVVNEEQSFSPLTEQINFNKQEYNSPYSKYLFLKSRSYQLEGEQKIDVLQQAFSQLKKMNKRKVDIVEEKGFCLGTIGLEYFLNGNYEQAQNFYKRAITLLEENDRAVDLSLVFNYVSTILKLGAYEKAITIIDRYKKAIKENEKVFYRFECMRAMAYIFLEKVEKAYDIIPFKISHRPEPQYHYFRFIYAIVFYLRGDVENALREVRNFYQTVQKRDSLEVNVLPIIQFYRKCFRLINNRGITIEKLKKLQSRITDYVKQTEPIHSEYLPFIWLREELKYQIKRRE